MNSTLLNRTSHRPAPELRVLGEVSLRLARCHEACGPARHSFAFLIAQQCQGPILWIRASWLPERLNAAAVLNWIDPGRLIIVEAARAEDILWSMEEALRAGAVPLVVADLPGPPALTPVRRLHLAAEAGAGQGRGAPLGLILTPGQGGAPGIETRWQITPDHALRQDRWHLTRSRARTEAPKSWQMIRTGSGFSLKSTAARENM
ncbi:MAG: hypothetical protein AAGA12_02955 [Pseudomonadota bacterium]